MHIALTESTVGRPCESRHTVFVRYLGVEGRADAGHHLQPHLLEGVHHLRVQPLQQAYACRRMDTCRPGVLCKIRPD